MSLSNLPQDDDFDLVDQINELREGCLEAYNGILISLKGDDGNSRLCSILDVACSQTPAADLALLAPHVGHIVSFISAIVLDQQISDACVRAALGIVGFVLFALLVFSHHATETSVLRLARTSRSSFSHSSQTRC